MKNITELKEYQVECVDNVFKMICEGKRRISILIPTGGGKTLLATMLAQKSMLYISKGTLFDRHDMCQRAM